MSEEEKSQTKDERLEAQRFAASSIGTMEYWDAYLDYREKNYGTKEWTRNKFLVFLQERFNTKELPLNVAISGKHNYVVNTKIPGLHTADPETWGWADQKTLRKFKIPPTARSRGGDWDSDKGDSIADRMKKMLG